MEAHDPTSKSITITWKAPDYDGGCPIQGYIVEKIEKDGDRYERVTPSLVPGFSYVVKDLKEGAEYQFRVRAENAAGVSEPSRSTQPVLAADPVGMKNLKYDLCECWNFLAYKLNLYNKNNFYCIYASIVFSPDLELSNLMLIYCPILYRHAIFIGSYTKYPTKLGPNLLYIKSV